MTDGIIQEISRNICSMLDFRAKVTPYDIMNYLHLYEQELIEKIKQEITTYGEPLSREIIYKILIGDNQE